MDHYEVTYMLLDNTCITPTGKPGMFNLKTIVRATGPNHAKELVEAMYGGYRNCQATSAWKQ